MGVLGESGDILDGTRLIEDLLEEISDHNSLEHVLPETPRKSRKVRHRLPKHGVKPLDLERGESHPVTGRKFRRYENISYLMTLAESQDFGEVDIYDFIPEHLSAFTQLLMDQESMRVWNDFISQTEEDQQAILESIHEQKAKTNDYQKDDEEKENAADVSKERLIHPAFTPDECFQRVTAKLQNVLYSKHLPWGLLSHLEEELTSFFIDWPQAVFICHLKNSFHRLLLHAICEYLDLFSQSFDYNGKRHTQVENFQEEFIPPSLSLLKYLEQKL